MPKLPYQRNTKKISKGSKYKKSYISRSLNPMMGDSTAYTKQVWTQSFELTSFTSTSAPTNFAYFVVACLGVGVTASGTDTNVINMNGVQNQAQTGTIEPSPISFNDSYFEKTCNGVSVKLIFPTSYKGNCPVQWCMAYSDTQYLTEGQMRTNKYSLQAIQGSQTGSIPASRYISKYFDMTQVKKNLGISWTSVGSDLTYYDQLTDKQPYVMCWVEYAKDLDPGIFCGTIAQITFYTEYKAKF